jgi:hypothetical protein
MPRRRRGANAVAVDAEAERGLMMRIFLHSPKDMVAGTLAFAAVSAIIINALFLQTGHHPSPMFGSVVALPPAGLATASPLPRPRPVEADTSAPEARPAEPKAAADPPPMVGSVVALPPTGLATASPLPRPRPVEANASAPEARPAEPKAADPLGNLVKATSVPPVAPSNVLRPPAPIPVSNHNEAGPRRVAAVQRTLTEYGYGQLKPTGTIGTDTQAAISKFEREHKMPVTGQMSDRLVHELIAMIGHPID